MARSRCGSSLVVWPCLAGLLCGCAAGPAPAPTPPDPAAAAVAKDALAAIAAREAQEGRRPVYGGREAAFGPSPPRAGSDDDYFIRRTGGPAGQTVEITLLPRDGFRLRRLAPDGRVLSDKRFGGNGNWLNDPRDFFPDASTVDAAEYPVPPGGYAYEFRHAGRTVRAGFSPDLPHHLRWLMCETDGLAAYSADPPEVAGPPAPAAPRKTASSAGGSSVTSSKLAAARPATNPADATPITITYDIRNLIIQIPDDADDPPAEAQPAARPSTEPVVPPGEENLKSRAELVRDVLDLIEQTIEVRPLDLTEKRGVLTVTSPPAGHLRLNNLLDQLRETGSLELWADAAVVQVNPGAVDPDARVLTEQLTAAASGLSPPTAAGRPRPTAQRTLESEQFERLTRTADAVLGVTILRLPRLRRRPDRRAVARVGEDVEYAAGVRPASRPGGPAEPVRATVFDGVSLDLSGQMDASRRYVNGDLRLSLTTVGRIEFVPPAADPPAADPPAADPPAAGAPVLTRRPVVSTTSLAGRFTVPDGGTVVLRGFVYGPTDPGDSSQTPRDDLFLVLRVRVPVGQDPTEGAMYKSYVR